MVRGVDAGRIVERVGVDLAPAQRRLDPAALGEAEIGALADDAGAQLVGVDAQRIVGAIAGVGLALARGLHVGADAAEIEQVDRRRQDGAHQVDRRHAGRLDAQHLPRLGRERDRLGGAVVDAAARRQERLVVVHPRRARQVEQPLALGPARRRVGHRVDEDVAVIEGGQKLDVARQQHAVAEHVARHVADAGDGEGRGLDVVAELAEVALHRFPGAARGDAHLLVVVARRAARGEGIVEPVAVFLGQRIGDVGEGGRALVGGDHEIGIVAVVAHDMGRRAHAALGVVVGDVQQAADQRLVAGDALGLDLLARAASRRLLDVEAALGADRHDDGVLHHLGLHQAQDLGAEILAPVGPADAAARHAAAAQMDALHARAVDEDLDQRPRRRQFVDGAAVDLEGDPVLGRAVRSGLPVIGAQGAAQRIPEAPQDAVLVERGDCFERGGELALDRVDLFLALVRRGLAQGGIEARQEEVGHQPRDRRIGAERALHVFLAEGDAGLSQVLGVGAQDRDLAPGKPGAQHQAVQPVAFQGARPQFVDRLDEARPDRQKVDRRLVHGLDGQHLQGDRLGAGSVQQERHFAQDPQAEMFGRRQDVGQRDRLARMEQAQGEAVQRLVGVALETHAEGLAIQCRLQRREIGHRLGGIETVAIDRREPVAPAARRGAAFDLAKLRLQGGAQAVAPRGRGLDQCLLELREVGRQACRWPRASVCRAPGRARNRC